MRRVTVDSDEPTHYLEFLKNDKIIGIIEPIQLSILISFILVHCEIGLRRSCIILTDITEVLLNYLIFGGLFSVALIFLYQTRKHARRAHELTMALFSGAFGQLFLTFGLFNQFNDETLSRYLLILGMLIYSLLFLFMFLHYEYEHRTMPSSRLLSVMMGIFGALVLALSLAFINYGKLGVSLTDLALFILYGLALYVFTQSFLVSFQASRRIPEKQQIIETISIGALLSGSIAYIIGTLFRTTLMELLGFSPLTIGDVLVIIGLFMLTGNYLAKIDFLYRLPIPIHQIILFNDAGVPVYVKKVQTRGLERINIQETLFTGTITAITSLIKETLGTSSRFRTLDAGNKQIFLESNNNVTALVITDKGTRFLLRSLKQLMKLIPEDIKDMLNKPMISSSEMEEKIDPLIKKAFPYVEFIS